MQSWNNGDTGEYVKKVIDNNFSALDARLSQAAFVYTKKFTESDWKDGIIKINRAEYNKIEPRVDLYIQNGDGYSIVFGGYSVTESGVELESDVAYTGKVVIR